MTDGEAALIAGWAYLTEAEARPIAESLGWKIAFVVEDDTEALVATREGEAVVGFRGTSSWKDLATDLRVKQKNSKTGGIHSGFDSYVDKVWKKLVLLVDNDHEKISVVGHSLGGAAAQLFALRFELWVGEIENVVTFGGPRVGDKRWKSEYDRYLGDHTRRYRRVLDPVPKLPPRRWGYRHTQGERYIDRNGKIHERISWWRAAWDKSMAMTFRRKLDLKPELLAAHSMVGYESLVT